MNIYIRISNTGKTISPERLTEINELLFGQRELSAFKGNHNGFALYNIKERLRIFITDIPLSIWSWMSILPELSLLLKGAVQMFQILIVDDERIILNGCSFMIKELLDLSFPVEVSLANNVPEAMSFLEKNTPDLILTDIRMPVMDGFELIEYIRSQGAFQPDCHLNQPCGFRICQKSSPL